MKSIRGDIFDCGKESSILKTRICRFVFFAILFQKPIDFGKGS